MMTQIDWDYSAELKPPSSPIDASMQIQFQTTQIGYQPLSTEKDKDIKHKPSKSDSLHRYAREVPTDHDW